MRLLGVVKVSSILSSRLGISATGDSIVEEFNAQMRAVSKIALTRKSNFSVFLEMNGKCIFCYYLQSIYLVNAHSVIQSIYLGYTLSVIIYSLSICMYSSNTIFVSFILVLGNMNAVCLTTIVFLWCGFVFHEK